MLTPAKKIAGLSVMNGADLFQLPPIRGKPLLSIIE